jgi:nanoRNase/pAp phosphatase (c-di-AMP/oligoRNAs hydrolase)
VCALGDPELNPTVWAKEVPQDLLAEIERAESVLVVADGDADGFGSAVALVRTLNLLGKRAVAYSSTPPPIEMQPLLDAKEVATNDVRETFDLVVHVDQDGERAGRAAQEAGRRAKRVAVIDHHDVSPDRSFVAWIDTGADAAALLTLGLIIRLTGGADLPARDWERILTPILAAIESDTHGLARDKTRPSTYGIVQYLLHHTSANFRAVIDAIDPFSQEMKELALRSMRVRIEGESPRRTGVFELDAAGFQALLEGVTRERPGAGAEDAYHLALTAVEKQLDLRSVDLSVALIERDDHIKISTRSRSPEDAVVLARAFGGNGKPGEGGSAIRHEHRSLKTESRRALRLLDNWRSNDLAGVVRRWRAGSL